MKPMVVSMVASVVAVMAGNVHAQEKQRDVPMQRQYLHRLVLSDGSWLVINTPFPADENRKETLAVRVHLYPKDVHHEKQTDKCLWVAEDLTSMEYVPGIDRSYALAKETRDSVFIFFTWNAHHCTIDKRTGKTLNKGEGDEELRAHHTMVPVKLLIWRRASDHRAAPGESTGDSDLPF
jgi:hypothetical protein